MKSLVFLAIAAATVFTLPVMAADAPANKAVQQQATTELNAIKMLYRPKLLAAKTPAEREAVQEKMRKEIEAKRAARHPGR